jgi:hypothetical protein
MESSTNAGTHGLIYLMEEIYPIHYTGITATTIFRAVTQNGSCYNKLKEPTLFIIPNIKPTPISASPSIICEGDTKLISDSSFSSSQNLYGGLFYAANLPAGR